MLGANCLRAKGKKPMGLTKLIAPDHRASGLSCRNCAHLACEYDLDAGGSGTWLCDKFPGLSSFGAFPFRQDMPCCELSFWFTVFAQNLNENDERGCEAAMEDFKKSVARLGGNGRPATGFSTSGLAPVI